MHLLDIFTLILFRDLDFATAWLQIDRDDFTEPVVIRREREVKHIGDIIVEHPLQTAMEIGVDTLHVSDRNLLVENHLVKRHDEEGIEEATVEDGQTDDTANEAEVIEMLRVDARMWVDLKRVVIVSGVLEQTVEGVEHLVREQKEEFTTKTFQSTRPTGWFPCLVSYRERPP